MRETPRPLAVLSAVLYHVPQPSTLGKDTGAIGKRSVNTDLEAAQGQQKEPAQAEWGKGAVF